jgi:hypothetical protein
MPSPDYRLGKIGRGSISLKRVVFSRETNGAYSFGGLSRLDLKYESFENLRGESVESLVGEWLPRDSTLRLISKY